MSTGCLGSPRTTKSHGNRGLSGSDNGSNDTEFDSFEVGPSLAAGGSTQYQVCTAATGASIFSGDDDCGAQIFRSLDDEGTGKLSFSQYLRWHRGRGLGGAGTGRASIGEGDIEGDEEDEYLIGAREYFLRYVDASPYLFLVLIIAGTS